MNKIALSPQVFNSLKRDPEGPKVQRVWIPELKGLGIEMAKFGKSFILKYKSPETGKYRILSLEKFSYAQVIDADDIEDIREDYSEKRKKIRAGVDPLCEKDEAREARKKVEADAQAERDKQAGIDKANLYTLNRATTLKTKCFEPEYACTPM